MEDEFGKAVYILDGGECEIGIESTVLGIIDEKTVEIYRPGMVTLENIQEIFKTSNLEVNIAYKQSPVAPGQLEHHYMPKTSVALSFQEELSTEQRNEITNTGNQLSEIAIWKLFNDPAIVARKLYAKLRDLDKTECDLIHIVLSKTYLEDENWKGIINRLTKASSFKFL